MKTKSSAALLGLFVIVAIFIAIAMLMALKGKRLFANNPTYTVQIDRSLKGLNVGAMVTFRGVKIGQVTNIVLMPLNTIMSQGQDASQAISSTNGWPLEVTIEIDPDTIDFDHAAVTRMWEAESDNKIKKNWKKVRNLFVIETGKALVDRWLEYMVEEHSMAAKLKLNSLLTGQLYIELDFNKDFQPSAEDIERLRKGYIPILETSADKLRAAFDNQKLIESITSTLNLFQDTILSGKAQQMVDNFHSATVNLRQAMNSANDLTNSMQAKIPGIMDNANNTITSISNNINTLAQDLQRTVRSVEGLTKDLESVLKEVKSDVDLKSGPLANLVANATQATTQLNTLLDSVNSLAASLKEPGANNQVERNAISQLIIELEDAARSIRQLANMLHDNPEVLIKGK